MTAAAAEVLHSVPWDHELTRNAAGSLELCVLCGGVGLFQVQFLLTEAESAQWHAEGVAFLQPWVRQIQGDPTPYRERARTSVHL